jgi:hypothetical protein
MAQPVYPDSRSQSSRQAFPLPQFIGRTRREYNTKDSINARQFEHWQTNGKHGENGRPDMNQQAPFYDMIPNVSRSNDRSYRAQPRYDAEGERGGQNSYFDKYDTSSDSRNMTRELRASVYEDKNTGYTKESNKLLERNFDSRWLDTTVMKQQAEAAEELRPKMDDIRLFYLNKPLGTHASPNPST